MRDVFLRRLQKDINYHSSLHPSMMMMKNNNQDIKRNTRELQTAKLIMLSALKDPVTVPLPLHSCVPPRPEQPFKLQ